MELDLNSNNLSDNIAYLKTLPDNSVDCIITDSPYGLSKKQNILKILTSWITVGFMEITGKGFMGKKWDAFVPQPVLWKECYRVLKPGGYLLSFFGTRTYHLGAIAIEIAGFEIRDMINWIYGSGFPKGKAQLKPACEPICVSRKPGSLQPLGIDESRIALNGDFKGGEANRTKGIGEPQNESVYSKANRSIHDNSVGRWPANIILDSASAELLDSQTGVLNSSQRKQGSIRKINPDGKYNTLGPFRALPKESYNDIGGASRFFFIADAEPDEYDKFYYCAKASPSERGGSTHPTIKPVKLMVHLVKLFCPAGGVVVDPHAGTGPTLEACLETGRNYIGIDNWEEAHHDANARIARWHAKQPKQKQLFKSL